MVALFPSPILLMKKGRFCKAKTSFVVTKLVSRRMWGQPSGLQIPSPFPGATLSLIHSLPKNTMSVSTFSFSYRWHFSFPFDLASLVRLQAVLRQDLYLVVSILTCSGLIRVQRHLVIDGMHWTWGCWLWHFKTAHFLQWHSVPEQQAWLPFSQNQETKLATKSKWPPARTLVQTKQNTPKCKPRGSEGQTH